MPPEAIDLASRLLQYSPSLRCTAVSWTSFDQILLLKVSNFIENMSRSFEKILHYFLFTLYTWAVGWLAPLLVSFHYFLSRFSSPS
jgi:hypothetical protein